jgi:hypothetical protein
MKVWFKWTFDNHTFESVTLTKADQDGFSGAVKEVHIYIDICIYTSKCLCMYLYMYIYVCMKVLHLLKPIKMDFQGLLI